MSLTVLTLFIWVCPSVWLAGWLADRLLSPASVPTHLAINTYKSAAYFDAHKCSEFVPVA